MKRWNTQRSLGAIKQGLISLFVFSVVLAPVALTALQFRQVLGKSDQRQVVATTPLAARPQDNTNAPIRPFEEPLISVTFDDGWESIYTDGLPLLQKYGIPTTQYVMSGVSDNPKYMTLDQIKSLRKAGHEIGCHTVDHSDLTTLSGVMVDKQLRDCKDYYERQLGQPVRQFASPYGASNDQTIQAIRGQYQSHRNTDGDIWNGITQSDVNQHADFDQYHIIAVSIRRDTTVKQLQAAIDYTIQTNGWLVLNYHDIQDGESAYGLDTTGLEAQLAAVSRAKSRVVTIGQTMDALERNGHLSHKHGVR